MCSAAQMQMFLFLLAGQTTGLLGLRACFMDYLIFKINFSPFKYLLKDSKCYRKLPVVGLKKSPYLWKPGLPSLVFLLINIERIRDARMPNAMKEQEEWGLESLPFLRGHKQLQQLAVL